MTVFGQYELQALIGQGGMGEVYRAFDREHGRLVALKLLPRDLARDGEFVERFRRESHAAARLRDPHVIPIHRFGELDGRLYIDMQLVDGHDLAHILRRSGRLEPGRAAHIVGQAAEALHAAHAENLVHRDVKPSNLLIAQDKGDFVYLVDFGIAHAIGHGTAGSSLTATGSTVGTFAYMAPERFSNRDGIDGRVDVYSLACVLFEMLTGRRPFPFDDLAIVIAAHLHAPPPTVTAVRPDLPAAWDAVIARGMAKDPALRYPTPRELAADAARAASASAPLLTPPPMPPAGVRMGPAGTLVGTAPAAAPPPTPSTQPAPSQPSSSQPPSSQPALSQPALSQPALSQPPASQPALSRPPSSQPALSQPPSSRSPSSQPALSQPPLSQPVLRRRPARAGWIAAAVLLVVVALGGVALVGFLRTGTVNAGNPNAAAGGTSTSTTTTTTTGPAVAGGSAAGSQPPPSSTAASSTSRTTTAPPAREPVGDLGLSVPISSPACDGSFAVLVAAAVQPGDYREEVQPFLNAFPGSSYLLAERSCSSLRPRTETGDSIYAVYYGPYAQLEDACATLARVGGGSYLRRLDNVTPVGQAVEC